MKNMKKMTALACAAMMMASMGITGCAKADGQTKEETKAVVVETPTGTETSATTENEATMLPGGENPEGTGAEAESEYAPFVGTVVSMENGELTMNRQVGDSTEEVIITISDDTKILDGVNGYPVEADTLTEGKAVNVYVGPAMTMSLPPIANGIMIITDIPEDAAFPKYTQVESLDQGSADGEFVLTTVDGSEYTITAETRLLPYLTKNIVSEEDLTEGTDILVWTSADDAAKTEKIVIFQSGN